MRLVGLEAKRRHPIGSGAAVVLCEAGVGYFLAGAFAGASFFGASFTSISCALI
jgi:hypothetical protein